MDGRRRTKVIDQVTGQAGAVAVALGGVPVDGIICVHRAEFPLFGKPSVAGVPIVNGRGMVRQLTDAATVLTKDEVDRLARLADARLPPANRDGRGSTGSV